MKPCSSRVLRIDAPMNPDPPIVYHCEHLQYYPQRSMFDLPVRRTLESLLMAGIVSMRFRFLEVLVDVGLLASEGRRDPKSDLIYQSRTRFKGAGSEFAWGRRNINLHTTSSIASQRPRSLYRFTVHALGAIPYGSHSCLVL